MNNITMTKGACKIPTNQLIKQLVKLNRGQGITFLYRIAEDGECHAHGRTCIPEKDLSTDELARLADRMLNLESFQLENIEEYSKLCSNSQHQDSIVKIYSKRGYSVALIHGSNNKIFSVAVYDSRHSKIGKNLAGCLLYAFSVINSHWDETLFENSYHFLPQELGVSAERIDEVVLEKRIDL